MAANPFSYCSRNGRGIAVKLFSAMAKIVAIIGPKSTSIEPPTKDFDAEFGRGICRKLQSNSSSVFTIGRSVCPGPAGGTICVFGPASDEAIPKSPCVRAAGYFKLRRVADMVELADTLL